MTSSIPASANHFDKQLAQECRVSILEMDLMLTEVLEKQMSIIGAKLLVKWAIRPMPYLINVSLPACTKSFAANRKKVKSRR